MPGINAVNQLSGATADENELLFISALHQTCVPNIRRNGTISSTDISCLLRSKYGVIITPETAKDIAIELAGAKLVKEKASESKGQNVLNVLRRRRESKMNNDDESKSANGQDEDPEAESDVYFDIVQLTALLLTPNILEFSQNGDTEVFERVLSQLLEPLYDIDEEKLRSTRVLDIDILRKILEAAGDFDTANDNAMMEQMIQIASIEGHFDTTSFMQALTTDVSKGFSEVEVSKTTNATATSTFFDVFGCNWEDSREVHTSDKYEKTSTWSHIDYASDSYHSYALNTLIWIEFMFGVLFYWIGVAKPFFTRHLTPSCGGFFCDVLRKMISWSITGAAMGTIGVLNICSFAYGNVNTVNKRKRVLGSIFSISLFIIPFVYFMIYRAKMPRHAVVYNQYRNVCPPDFVKNDRKPFSTDYKCRSGKDFCLIHREFQGKNLLKNPRRLTQEEKLRCNDSARRYRQYELAHILVNNTVDPSGKCFNHDDCTYQNYKGKCGYPSGEANITEKVCCLSKEVFVRDNRTICTNQKIGASCLNNAECESEMCGNGTCVKKEFEERQYLDGDCEYDDECVSEFCFANKCQMEFSVCPVTTLGVPNITLFDRVILANIRIQPVCVTKDKFCEDNINFYANCKEQIIPYLSFINLLDVKPENEVEKIEIVQENLDSTEVLLKDTINFSALVISGALCCLLIPIYFFFGFKNKDNHYRDAALKSAAESKTKLIVANALKLHQSHDSTSEMEGITMRNYFNHDRDEVTIGGLGWIIAAFRSGELFEKHGIFIPGRFIVANIAQFLTIIVLLVVGLIVVRDTSEELDTFLRKNLPLTDEAIQSMTDEDFYNLSYIATLSYYAPKGFIKHLPSGRMIEQSFYPGVIVALFTSIYATVILIPSFIHTTLELRSGKILTFYCKRFSGLRGTSDQVVSTLGSLFFSLIGSFVVAMLVVGLAILVFVHPTTRGFGLKMLALGVGIGTSMILKQFLQGMIRKRCFQALMRKDTKIGNIASIFFECWFIATATLTVVIRIASILVQTCINVGRLDVSFLHPDIGGDTKADTFRREILVQEAHCHPYIERLSGMYLRRLKYGEKFGSAAGQAWRSLFVIGMCPWLIRYRENVSFLNDHKSADISKQNTSTKSACLDDSRSV